MPAHSPRTIFTLDIQLLVWIVRMKDARKFHARIGKDGSTTVQILVSFTRIYRPDFLFAWSHCMQHKLYVVIGVSAALAVATACGRQGASPVSPSGARPIVSVDEVAGPNGATLKV